MVISEEYAQQEGKRARLDGGASQATQDTNGNGAAAYTGPTISAGSVTPVEDFQAIVDYAVANGAGANAAAISTAVRDSMDVLEGIITMLVTRGGTQPHFRKAVACVKVYRRAAIQFHESARYNKFLREGIKYTFCTGRHAGFWKMLSSEPLSDITLISMVEDETSDVTQESAEAFIGEDVKVDVAPVNVAPVATEDDLFEDMA